jgi:DNA primase
MSSIVEFVQSKVDPVKYWESVFPDVRWPGGSSEARVCCCFHDEKTPSLSINPTTGKWYCHGCEKGGNSIVSFHAEREECDRQDAAAEIYGDYVRPIIDGKTVRKWHIALLETPSALRYVSQSRRISAEQIKARLIGWNGTRITLPVVNEFGLFVNVKMYDPLAKKHGLPKMLNFKRKGDDRSYGSPPMIYPIAAFKLAKEKGYIVICEGEWDALFLMSLGIPAVTGTCGAKSWPHQYTEMFRGLRVIIAYDNDHDGMMYDRKVVAKNLMKVAKKISRLNIPLLPLPNKKDKKSKDVSEWADAAEEMRTKAGWLKAFKTAKTIVNNPDEYVNKSEASIVSLDQASQARWYNKPLVVDALVTGKDTAPYILPQKVRLSCSKECDMCPIAEGRNSSRRSRSTRVTPRSWR